MRALSWDKLLRLLEKFWDHEYLSWITDATSISQSVRMCASSCVCVCVLWPGVKTGCPAAKRTGMRLQNSPNIKVKLQRETSWSQGVLLATADELTGGVCEAWKDPPVYVCVCVRGLAERIWARVAKR